MKNKKIYLLLLIPSFFMITVFMILPLAKMLLSSFYEGSFWFSQYIEFLQDDLYLNIVYRTIKISLIVTGICVIFSIPTAFFISRSKNNTEKFLTAIILFPLLTNGVIRAFAWMNMLGKNGVINSFLLFCGLIKEPLRMMYTEFAIIVGSVYLFLPLMIVTLVAVMSSIPDDYIEAAMSLGAGFTKVFLKIVIPLSASGIVVGSVLVFTGVLSAYTTPSMLGGDKNMMLTTLLNQQAGLLSDLNKASVVAFVMIVLSLTVMWIMNKFENKLDKRGNENV